MTLSRWLFRAASKALDVETLLSGNPKRIIKHTARKRATRYTSRAVRWLLK